MKVSEHFSRSEFSCRCGCGFCAVDIELLMILEGLRSALGGRRVTINSACRCDFHNAAIGGTSGSFHIKAMAADIVVQGVPARNVADYLESHYPEKYGIGRYQEFTHIDVRDQAARWTG